MENRARELGLKVDRGTGVPMGTQLAARLAAHVRSGALRPGERLPSVRELAEEAGVNVNTVRAVYSRLERDGIVRSEQGRGTFVGRTQGSDGATRADLRRQIASLEAQLVARAPLPSDSFAAPSPTGGRLPTTDELRAIRDRLEGRLTELDAERADVLRRLSELAAPDHPAAGETAERRSSTSLRGARVRWLGA